MEEYHDVSTDWRTSPYYSKKAISIKHYWNFTREMKNDRILSGKLHTKCIQTEGESI